MKQTGEYCPYEITSDPTEFNLTAELLDCGFGKLYVVHSSQKSNTVTLFLHGVGGTWASWTPLLRAAQNNNILGDTIFVDLPGFGLSENKLGHLKASVVGAELLGIIEKLGWSKIDVVGHSMGGFLALDIAVKGNPSIKSVSVVSGTYFSVIKSVQNPVKTLFRQPSTSIAYSSMILLSKLGPLAGWLLKKTKHSSLFTKFLAKTFAHPRLLKHSVVDSIADNVRPKSFTLAAKNGKDYDPEMEWGKITVPFRALFGATDQLVPTSDMERLETSLSNMQAVCLADTGHFAHVERPYETLEWLYG